MNQRFEEAKTIYKKLGIDVDEALKQLQRECNIKCVNR